MRFFAATACAVTVLLAACEAPTTEESPVEEGEFAEDEVVETATIAPPEEPSFGVDARPVRVGIDGPEMDACGGYGEITGLNPDGDNFLSVRAAPSTDAEELDRLNSGTGVSLCEEADGWIGIVYEASGASGTDCGTGSPVTSERDYDGPCRSGWVSQRFIELIAG